MRRLAFALCLGAFAFPSAADGATVKCRGWKYAMPPGHPQITALTVFMKAKRVSGYAPRCLVGESVATTLERRSRQHLKTFRVINVYGARWNAGRFGCRATHKGNGLYRVICRGQARHKATVRFRMDYGH